MTGRLSGFTVAITRAADSAAGLSDALTNEGASIAAVPVIAIGGPSDGGVRLASELASLSDGDLVVVTSAHGARALLEHAPEQRPTGVTVAAVGPATAGPLSSTPWNVRVTAATHTAAALADQLGSPERSGRVLYIAAAEPRPEFEEIMSASGWQVNVIEAYRTMLVEPDTTAVGAAEAADAITFTSGSTVRGWLAVSTPERTPRTISMGPSTTAAAIELGLSVATEASEQTIGGLVEAVVGALTS